MMLSAARSTGEAGKLVEVVGGKGVGETSVDERLKAVDRKD